MKIGEKTQKDFSFETPSVPDFEILWGEWGHIELKSGVDRPYGTFCLYGGTLRPVVKYFSHFRLGHETHRNFFTTLLAVILDYLTFKLTTLLGIEKPLLVAHLPQTKFNPKCM